MRWTTGVVVAALLAVGTSGCVDGGVGPNGLRGECGARVRFHSTVYRPHTLLRPSLPVGRLLGHGQVIGCGRKEAAVVDRVTLHAVRGVDPGTAVVVTSRKWDGPYVEEHLRPSQWPHRLHRR